MKINKKLIKELVDNLEEFKLTELEYSEKDIKIKVSRQTKVSQNISPEIRIEKTNTGIIRTADDVEEGIASQDVLEYKPSRTDADPETKKTITDPEEYNEGSVFPDSEGKMKEVEDLDIEELLEFIKNEKAN